MEEKKIKSLTLTNDPCIHTRSVLFDDDKTLIKNKNKKQFITCKNSMLIVQFTDGSTVKLFAPKGTIFDGATIPFNIGKGNMKLLIPALFHDIMCDDKSLIDYNRQIADEIFREALIKCKVNKALANFMFLQVELYQMLFCDWRKK